VYPFLRLGRVTLGALWGRRLEPLEESRLRLRVWLGDLDSNLHLNNGRFLTLMDLGRWDLAVRSGMLRVMLAQRWQPLVGGVLIRFRRPLPPLRAFHLCTRLLGWDHKWFFLEQRFEQDGHLKAQALVRFLVRRRGENLAPGEVAAALGYPAQSPPLPEVVQRWQEMEALV